MARSLSPHSAATTGNGNNEVGDLDDTFVDLWARHIEPKLAQKNEEIDGGIKNIVQGLVKDGVNRLENGHRICGDQIFLG